MKTMWTVAAREFAARKIVLYAGLLAALLAFCSPFVPGASRVNPSELRAIVVLMVGTSVAVGSALLVGSSLFGPDLSEKRLAWYFSRPIAPAALWWGKLAGGFGVVLVASAIAWSPVALNTTSLVTLTGAGLMTAPATALMQLSLAGALLLLLFLLANAVSVAFRSHSLWLLFDAAGLTVTGLAVWFAARILWLADGESVFIVLAGFLVLALIGALAAAGARQVALGRTDPKSAHGTLSRTLWSIVVSTAFAALGYAAWAVSYSPSDLRNLTAAVAPAGKWILLDGEVAGRPVELFGSKATGRERAFYGAALVDSESSRFVRLSMKTAWTLTFSRDGRRAAWAERDGIWRNGPLTVMVLDTDSPGAAPRASRIVIGKARDLELLTLSPDGSRIAVIAAKTLAVHDVGTGAMLGAIRLPDQADRGRRIRFESPTSVFLFQPFTPAESALYRFDLASKKLEKTGSVRSDNSISGSFLRLSPAGDRILLSSHTIGTWLLDGVTGERIAALAPPDDWNLSRSQLLADGRIAVGRLDGGNLTLQLYSRNGVLESSIPVGPARSCRIGGEVAPGKLQLVASSREAGQEGARYARILVVDLAKGTVTQVADDLAPGVMGFPMWIPSDLAWGTPGSLGTRLLRSKDSKMFLIDPVTLRPAPFSPWGR